MQCAASLQTSNHSASSPARKRETSSTYAVNRDFFIYDELQKIVLKTEGIAKIIKEDLARFSNIECMFIYGSFAQGTAGAKSDIDLFIVGDVDENSLIPLVHTSERAINREINYTLMHRDELRKTKAGRRSFRKECNERAKDYDHRSLR